MCYLIYVDKKSTKEIYITPSVGHIYLFYPHLIF